MDKSGIVSKACIAHHYWHNMDDPKCFFKLMVGDFKNGVTIPKKFVANIREQMSEQVTLKVPNGKTYTVEVAEEQQNKLVLRSGWEEFSSAYKLEQCDLLVFKNSGNSLLKVRIFDQSGCEKELSCVLLDDIPCMQERKGSHGKQLQSPTGKRLAVGSPSGSIRKTLKMNPIDSPSPQKKTEHVPSSEGIHQEPINSGASPKLIKPINSGYHGKQMQSPTGKRLAVGSPSGSRKTPKMNAIDSPSSQNERHVSPSKRHEVAKPSCMLPRHKSLTEQRSKVEEKVGAIQSETPKRNPTDSPSQKKTERVPSSEGIHQEPINSGASRKFIKSWTVLPTGCSMTSEQKARVIALEQKIQPKVPFYITAMHKKTLDSGILAIEKKYAIKHLVDENGTIQLYQLDGSKVWPISLDITADVHCAVSKGWMGFIHHNKLQEGDICIFQPSKNKEGVQLIFHPLAQNCRLQPPEHVPSAKSPRHGAAKPPYILPRKASLTDEQKSKVEEKLRGIQSEIPVYVTVIKNSYVKRKLCILEIGSDYATKYVTGGDKSQLTMTMRLRCPGRSKDDEWEPEFRVNKQGRHQIVGEGWRKFVTDNKLKGDDICLFNLVKNTKTLLLMDVHIIRTLEESCCPRPPGHVSSTKRHGVAKPPYMLPCRVSLTDEQRSKIENKVRAIQSEIPVYVAVMTESNVNRLYIMGFGAEYAREYLPSESENQLTMRLWHKGNAWESEFRAKDRRHLILGKGWRKFVTDNRLKVDDICLFDLRTNTKTLTMDVHIIRK